MSEWIFHGPSCFKNYLIMKNLPTTPGDKGAFSLDISWECLLLNPSCYGKITYLSEGFIFQGPPRF